MSGRKTRSEEEIEGTEQPGRKGGRTATTLSISAASIAKVLSGIVDLPKSKSSIKDHAKKNVSNVEVEDKNRILDIIDKLPEREYSNMADVEKSISTVM